MAMAPCPTAAIAAVLLALAASASASTRANPTSGILAATNTQRAQHGASALVWDDGIASNAQTWANTCQYQHSTGASYGENLYASWGVTYPADGKDTCSAAAQAWYNEVNMSGSSCSWYCCQCRRTTGLPWQLLRRRSHRALCASRVGQHHQAGLRRGHLLRRHDAGGVSVRPSAHRHGGSGRRRATPGQCAAHDVPDHSSRRQLLHLLGWHVLCLLRFSNQRSAGGWLVHRGASSATPTLALAATSRPLAATSQPLAPATQALAATSRPLATSAQALAPASQLLAPSTQALAVASQPLAIAAASPAISSTPEALAPSPQTVPPTSQPLAPSPATPTRAAIPTSPQALASPTALSTSPQAVAPAAQALTATSQPASQATSTAAKALAATPNATTNQALPTSPQAVGPPVEAVASSP